jgi:hypothetical protein
MVTILAKKGQSTLKPIHLCRSKACISQKNLVVGRIEPESSKHGGQ